MAVYSNFDPVGARDRNRLIGFGFPPLVDWKTSKFGRQNGRSCIRIHNLVDGLRHWGFLDGTTGHYIAFYSVDN